MMLNKVGEVLLLTKQRHCILSPLVMYLITIALKLNELKLNEVQVKLNNLNPLMPDVNKKVTHT